MSAYNTIFLFIIIGLPLLLAQSFWMFQDARKRGESYYWLWGLLGLLNAPTPLIVYLLVTRSRQNKCKNCGKHVYNEFNTCPHCGESLSKICATCKKVVDEKWDYCPWCSSKLK